MPGPFAYLNSIPQPNDQLSVSQPQILTNFASIKSLVDIDHVDFASADAGKHNQVTLPVNSNSPAAPVFTSPNIGFYNLIPAAAPLTTINELFINKYVNGLVQKQIPMTASTLSTNAAPASLSNGYTYLPSGIIMKWGSFAWNAAGPILFDTAIPFTQVLSLQLTSIQGATPRTVSLNGPVASTGFLYSTDATGGTISYLAIGY